MPDQGGGARPASEHLPSLTGAKPPKLDDLENTGRELAGEPDTSKDSPKPELPQPDPEPDPSTSVESVLGDVSSPVTDAFGSSGTGTPPPPPPPPPRPPARPSREWEIGDAAKWMDNVMRDAKPREKPEEPATPDDDPGLDFPAVALPGVGDSATTGAGRVEDAFGDERINEAEHVRRPHDKGFKAEPEDGRGGAASDKESPPTVEPWRPERWPRDRSEREPAESGRNPFLLAGPAAVVTLILIWWLVTSGSPQVGSSATGAPLPTTTSRVEATLPPGVTAPPVAATAPRPTATTVTIRVDGQTAQYAGPCSGYTVTFVWTLRGAQSGNFLYRVAKGESYGPEQGPFILTTAGDLTWDPATGRLTIRGAADSARSPGFKAQITKVNGRDVEGDATSIANPGYCG